ncbi:hypothetical protein ACEPPN_016204 [Leptodophora sp. 'Broadleaf-Isolate-01']
MPTNRHLSLLTQAKPHSHSKSSSLQINEKQDLESPTQRPYASKFDKAIRVCISHFSEKAVKRALKEVTSQEETPPSAPATQTLLAQGLSSFMVKSIQKIPLEYKPSYLEATASTHSELGNSIYNSSSVARRSVDLYGLRVFKACAVVHGMVRGLDGGVEGRVEEGVREELEWWFEVLRHDLEVGGGERGYGSLLASYITYLKALLASLATAAGSAEACAVLTAHQDFSLSNHTFREALLAFIKSCSVSSTGAKIAALRLVLMDAMEFPVVHEKLLGLMKREGASEAVVEERERVFEMRREEVVGFLKRCEGLGLDLDTDLKREDRIVDIEKLEAKVGKLRV